MLDDIVFESLLKQHQPKHHNTTSESFTNCNSLLGYLDQDWQVTDFLVCEYPVYSGRTVKVYHVKLHKDADSIILKIVNNPAVARLFQQHTHSKQHDNKPAAIAAQN